MPEVPAARLAEWSAQERLIFLLTNHVPRRLLTRAMRRYAAIESPTLARWSIALWRLFSPDLDLSEARETEFRSLRDCFVRELRAGARTIDPRPEVVASPCDAIVGACGAIEGTRVYQAKGLPYDLDELLPDAALRERLRDGTFVTLRLRSTMYHRFHAPVDARVREITYISGDTWNVDPISVARIEKLFCKNERAVVSLEIGEDQRPGDPRTLVLVPVAAILVASMRFHCLPEPLDLAYRGPNRIACDARFQKGQEIGWFEHGSTILVFASRHHRLAEGVVPGTRIEMGRQLLIDTERERRRSI